ncbi:MAG: hypothetical protein BWX74_00204 [Tenericutes bacterium ADurb.Bin087]|nr:MAG: hypothetical protein BWX74_00204 [Tenericutes bacterium ADurb.Bin087]
MVIIKIYSQDVYVAAEISVKYADEIAKSLGLTKEDVFIIGSDGALIAEGVDQVSWFTYLEVSLPANLKHKQDALSKVLLEVFSNYGVHLMIKYDYVQKENIVKILNPDFKVFNETMVEVYSHGNYYEDENEDLDEDWDDEEDE